MGLGPTTLTVNSTFQQLLVTDSSPPTVQVATGPATDTTPFERIANKGQASGYAGLDNYSIVPQAQRGDKVYNVLQGGAKGDGVNPDATPIQAQIDALWNGGNGEGGILLFPTASAVYLLEKALVVPPRVRLVGQQTRTVFGQTGSQLRASPTGDFTNGPIPAKYMLKYQGGDNWWHGGALEHIALDCNNVAVGGAHFQSPGENSIIEFCRVDNAAPTPRTVNDAVTNGTTTVTSATAAFTEDDVNAVVTGTNIPASTKIDRVVNATTVTLNNAASGSGSAGALTINRPNDGVVFDGDAPTGLCRSLNGINNSGALLRIKNMSSGSWLIESLSGDSNGGGLLRASKAAIAADPATITLINPKAENKTGDLRGLVTSMDPVILLDNCDMLGLTIIGGSIVTQVAGRDVIRVDQPVTTRGGPSIHAVGLEGANPFNNAYTNIIRDSSTGAVIAATSSSRFYPNVLWGRNMRLGQNATVPELETWKQSIMIGAAPPFATYNGAGWVFSYTNGYYHNSFQYNGTNVQNDGGAWKTTLSQGTWRLDVFGGKASNSAIATVDFSFDGGATWQAVGTFDGYNATSAVGNWSFTGINVPQSGPALIRFRALTRNASNTTGWGIILSGLELSRTA